MTWRRSGPAALLFLGAAVPAAATALEPERSPEAADLRARAYADGEAARAEVAAPGMPTRPGIPAAGWMLAPQTNPSVFGRGGAWARAEVSALVGSQFVNDDLGSSRNIFQTVSAEADDVGFGEHFGARGAFFVNRYLGAEAGVTRTTTEFDFSVSDEDAGLTVFEEGLVQESREVLVSAVAQLPLAALTPYAALGYGWKNAENEGSDPSDSRALVFGFGIKVPFPRIPVALAFDYRYVRYPRTDDGLRLAEGSGGGASVSALTFGVVVRFAVRD